MVTIVPAGDDGDHDDGDPIPAPVESLPRWEMTAGDGPTAAETGDGQRAEAEAQPPDDPTGTARPAADQNPGSTPPANQPDRTP